MRRGNGADAKGRRQIRRQEATDRPRRPHRREYGADATQKDQISIDADVPGAYHQSSLQTLHLLCHNGQNLRVHEIKGIKAAPRASSSDCFKHAVRRQLVDSQ
jgi:hypothetical protein